MVPKKFLCQFPLSTGTLSVGGLMICISVASSIAILVQVLKFAECSGCPHYVWRNAYGFNVTALLYSLIMLGVHVWLIFGVIFNKASIVLSWVVITSMWLALTLCLLIVLIYMYSVDTNLVTWLLCLIFGIIAIGILIYTILVVFGFWIELKEQERSKKLAIPATNQ